MVRVNKKHLNNETKVKIRSSLLLVSTLLWSPALLAHHGGSLELDWIGLALMMIGILLATVASRFDDGGHAQAPKLNEPEMEQSLSVEYAK